MNRLRALAILACAASAIACDKNKITDINSAPPVAAIRFFNFSVNGPGVNFYANSVKMTAISSTSGAESTSGTAYGAAGDAGFYSGIAPGTYTINGKIAAATDKDLAISNTSATIESGKSYSYYLSGFYDATAKTTDAFIVEDPLPAAFDYTQAYVRFVNAISNSSPMTLYAKNTTTSVEVPVGGLVAYKTAGAFAPLAGVTYDLSTRTAGSTANAIARTGVTFAPGHMYTITARGDMTVISTTATNRPFLDNTANR